MNKSKDIEKLEYIGKSYSNTILFSKEILSISRVFIKYF